MNCLPIDIDKVEEFRTFFPGILNLLESYTDKDNNIALDLFNSYFKTSEISERLRNEGIAVPKVMIISPTMRCNLSCVGCYSKKYSREDELALEELDRVITESERLGIFFFIISGGEPFLKEGLFDVLKNHRSSFFWIFSNGTLFNKELAAEVKEKFTGFLIFSLEGFEDETDFWRGKGTYKKVAKAMEYARGEGIPFGFSVTPTKLNIDALTGGEFLDKMINRGCTIGIFSHYNHSANVPDVFSCDQKDRESLKSLLKKSKEEKKIFLIDTRYMEELGGGCCGGNEILHINSQGYVTPCPLLNITADSIREKSLKDILSSELFSGIRGRRDSFIIGSCPDTNV